MTTYYLSSVDGSNGDTGLSWALAVATLEYAVETLAATGGPHTILVDSAHSESLSADTTITAAQDLRILSVNRSGSDVPLAGGKVGGQTGTNYALTFNGAFDVYVYGITFSAGTNASGSRNVTIGGTDGAHFELEECTLQPSASGGLVVGGAGANYNGIVKVSGGSINFQASGAGMLAHGRLLMKDVSLAGTAVTKLFYTYANGTYVEMEGCDLSSLTGTLVGDQGTNGGSSTVLRNCILGSGVTLMAAPTTISNLGQTQVEAFNCNAGDAHYSYYHGDAFGETTVSNTIYATAGAQSGGANVSYKIVTRASNCSYYTPYVGPWIAKYHTGTSAVTPSFEILRDGSATAYQDDEVWGEWSYQGTSGSTQASYVNDRMTPLGTPANQGTGALGAGDWTGENATAWFGKLAPASTITPAEVGHIMGRVVVGEPNITIYYDPTVRLA